MTKTKGVGSTWGSINNVRAVGDFVDGLATERDRYIFGYCIARICGIFAAVRLYMSRTRMLSETCLMC